MKGSIRQKYLSDKLAVTILVLLGGVICLMPFAWMISTSFKYELDVFEYPIRWIPKRWNFDTYKTVFTESMFYLYYLNTIKVTFFSVIGNLFFAAMTGYAFARLRFKGRNILFLVYLSSIMIPNQVVLVPKYILFRYMGMQDTHLALILPAIFEVFSVFLFRQAFMTVPYDFKEAALIDGAGQFRIFWQIILPMVKPTAMTLALLNFNGAWNDYINPKTYISSDILYTLSVGLQKFQLSNSSNYSTIMAGTAISLIPIILLFVFTQKYFVDSFVSSGIKG